MDSKNTRTAQVMKDGRWIDIAPDQIKKNNLFRMFEPDGTPIKLGSGEFMEFAVKDAYINSVGVVIVEINS